MLSTTASGLTYGILFPPLQLVRVLAFFPLLLNCEPVAVRHNAKGPRPQGGIRRATPRLETEAIGMQWADDFFALHHAPGERRPFMGAAVLERVESARTLKDGSLCAVHPDCSARSLPNLLRPDEGLVARCPYGLQGVGKRGLSQSEP